MCGLKVLWPEVTDFACQPWFETYSSWFICSHLAKRLKSEGHYIVACDWKRNEHMPVSRLKDWFVAVPVWSAPLSGGLGRDGAYSVVVPVPHF